jgi:hypothetical protein
MSSSSSHRGRSIEKVEGKRVQGYIGGWVPTHPARSRSLSLRLSYKKRFQDVRWVPESIPVPIKIFDMVEGRPVGDSIAHYTVGNTQRWQFPNDPNKILVYG